MAPHDDSDSPDEMRHFRSVAASDAPAWIVGEDGTGKETLAWHMHRHSRRAEGPFLTFQCQDIPESLLECELFGVMKGSFTGRGHRLQGSFEHANQGTLVIIGAQELPPQLQVKLLRFIVQGVFNVIGTSGLQGADIRLIFTSTIDLEREVHEARFRADLFDILKTNGLRLPPLQDRLDEISRIVSGLGELLTRRELYGLYQGRPPSFSDGAFLALRQAPWKENLRELEQTLLCALADAREGEPIGPGRLALGLEPAQKAARQVYALTRALEATPRGSEGLEGAEAFLGGLEGALRDYRKNRSRSTAHNEKEQPPAVYPLLGPVPPPLAPAVALLARLDLHKNEPRWPLLRAENGISRLLASDPALLAPRAFVAAGAS